MKLSMLIDTTSPILAASGVAMLSGLILYLVVSRMTATRTKSDWTRKCYLYQNLANKQEEGSLKTNDYESLRRSR